jgi:hypothetical protein
MQRMADWQAHFEREQARYEDGVSRLRGDASDDDRQRQLTRIANAAYGAGLALLMAGRRPEAVEWLDRSADCYRASFTLAPPESWGRPIAVLKARLLIGERDEIEAAALWTLELGAAEADSPIGRYAACLALAALGRYEELRVLADGLRTRDDFPVSVADTLAMIGAGTDAIGYVEAVEAVLESFEQREEYLEDIAVADTVLVLQALAARRGLIAELESPLLPSA